MKDKTKKECVQCSAALANGGRCGNWTCIYPKYCWIHTKDRVGVEIKKSKIKGAGKGIFATKAFNPGDKVVDYGGELMSQKKSDKLDTGYAASVSGGQVRDGASTQSGLGRYANSCRTANKRKRQCKRK